MLPTDAAHCDHDAVATDLRQPQPWRHSWVVEAQGSIELASGQHTLMQVRPQVRFLPDVPAQAVEPYSRRASSGTAAYQWLARVHSMKHSMPLQQMSMGTRQLGVVDALCGWHNEPVVSCRRERQGTDMRQGHIALLCS
jgi:hypothetical protein